VHVGVVRACQLGAPLGGLPDRVTASHGPSCHSAGHCTSSHDCVHIHIHTHMHRCVRASTRSYTCAHTKHACADAHAHAHARVHVRAHTHAHTHLTLPAPPSDCRPQDTRFTPPNWKRKQAVRFLVHSLVAWLLLLITYLVIPARVTNVLSKWNMLAAFATHLLDNSFCGRPWCVCFACLCVYMCTCRHLCSCAPYVCACVCKHASVGLWTFERVPTHLGAPRGAAHAVGLGLGLGLG